MCELGTSDKGTPTVDSVCSNMDLYTRGST